MINAGTGNLIVQADDVNVNERGIDLALRRTYNSMSGHDVNGTDGSGPSLFGNKWTNTFDAHLAFNALANTLTVYDIDGASYLYSSNETGGWTPPPGEHALLTFDGSCGYYWTKKSGTSYYFYAPYSTKCGYPAGTYGRVSQIFSRNHNSAISFTYSWSGAGTNLEQLTQIIASHSDGQSLTLNFSAFGSYTELSSIVRPDGDSITYSYDGNGNLLEVDHPENIAGPSIPQTYAYSTTASGPTMSVYSPRATVAARDSAQDGEFYTVQFDNSYHVSETWMTGLFNPTPSDGTNIPLQSGATWLVQDDETWSGFGTDSTGVTDSNGHSESYVFDGSFRPIQQNVWTGTQWLTSSNQWDANNNLVETTDPRGNTTDYAFDANGNTVGVASPSVSTSSNGTIRPTTLISYDTYNNVIAYCSPDFVASKGWNWNPSAGGPETCPRGPGASQYWYTQPTYEPYGELTDTYTPTNYRHTYSYVTSSTADYGRPLSVTGDTIAQSDGTNRTPTETFTYDVYGNVQTYNGGNGIWRLTYDANNRLASQTDPDGVVISSMIYNPGGRLVSVQSAANLAAGKATSYGYDADGDETSETHWHGCVTTGTCVPGVTQKWYDGDDRLIEIQYPHDLVYDLTSYPWITRYLYDLTSNGTTGSVSFASGATFKAYGNLYKTQEYLPSRTGLLTEALPSISGNPTFIDVKGSSFDALDRKTSDMRFDNNSSAIVAHSYTFDGTGDKSLVSSECNEVQQCTYYTYDARNMKNTVTHTSSASLPISANVQYAYDAVGRPSSVTESGYGTWTKTYNLDGDVTTYAEPATSGTTSNAVLSYSYYGTDDRQSLSVKSSALTASPLLSYSYRPDGKRQTIALSATGVSATIARTYSFAGRFSSQLESGSSVAANEKTSYTYDSYGRVASFGFPRATSPYKFTQYDAEGDPTGLTAEVLGSSGGGVTSTPYTVRGEALGPIWTFQAAAEVGKPIGYLNGLLVNVGSSGAGCAKTASATIDTVRSIETMSSGPNPAPSCPAATSPTGTVNYYDLASRNTKVDSGFGEGNNVYSRAFDNDNHIVSQSGNAVPITRGGCENYAGNYSWDPLGHLNVLDMAMVWNGSPKNCPGSALPQAEPETLHWDGDSLLFATSSAGTLDDIKIDSTADYTPNNVGYSTSGTNYSGLTLWDRGPDGTLLACHNLSGSSLESLGQAYRAATTCLGPLQPGNGFSVGGSQAILMQPGTDGYTDGVNVFQGARTFDPNIGAFTTPDAFAGELQDPMSQKPFIWNRNNPYDYEDPSGFDSISLVFRHVFNNHDNFWNGVAAFLLSGQWHSYIQVKQDDGTIIRYSFGQSADDHLRLMPQSYDDWTLPGQSGLKPTKEVLLASCKGTCTKSNGGFDEASLGREASLIDQLDLEYTPYEGLDGPNSNSASLTLCVVGGGGSQCYVQLPWLVSAPGGRTLIDPTGNLQGITDAIGGLDPQ